MTICGPRALVLPVRIWRPGTVPLIQQGCGILAQCLVNLFHKRGRRLWSKRRQLTLCSFNFGLLAGFGCAGRRQNTRMLPAELQFSLLAHRLKKPLSEEVKHCLRVRFLGIAACHNSWPSASGATSRPPFAT